MSPLEIISRLCDVTENLSAIVKKQQTIIEQSKIEETVRAELRQEVEETDREMDVLEYHMRKYCDTDDIEATEFGNVIIRGLTPANTWLQICRVKD